MGEDTKFVIPAEGCLVRYPGTKTQLPATGANVPWSGKDGTYWRRREMDKSIIVVTPKIETPSVEQTSESTRSTRRAER